MHNAPSHGSSVLQTAMAVYNVNYLCSLRQELVKKAHALFKELPYCHKPTGVWARSLVVVIDEVPSKCITRALAVCLLRYILDLRR